MDATLAPIAAELERTELNEQGHPLLTKLVIKHLTTLAIGEAPAATRIMVAAYVRDVLERDAVDRLNRTIRAQQRSRSRSRKRDK